jgi:glycosyltransferase involved in cell wall biosynthesis
MTADKEPGAPSGTFGAMSEVTRVVVASRLFPPEAGAAAYRLGSLVRRLADSGVEVEVLTTTPPKGVRAAWQARGTTLRRWPVLRDRGGNVRGYVQYASFDVPLLFRLLLTRRPGVVVVEPPPTTGVAVRLACWVRRLPYVYYAGDVSTTAAAGIGVPPPVVAVLRVVESWVLRHASLVLAVSDGVAADVRMLAGDRTPVAVVGTGVDTDTFRPVPSGPRTRTLVYAGTMSEIQGARVFVEAFASIAADFPDASLVMYGQGAEAHELESLAQRLVPGRVRFPGVVSGTEVAAAVTSAAAGLASLRPGAGYDYAYPTKMFAVTACGTPVIYAGPGPGRAAVAEHDLGWAVDWEVSAVATVMAEALRADVTADRAERLVAWTRAHASQNEVARRAVESLLTVLSPAALALGSASSGGPQPGTEGPQDLA